MVSQAMKVSYMFIFLICLLSLLSKHCHSTTILVDGVLVWKNPSVHIGDSIIFKHKYHYNLYIFHNQNAFNLCNFTQATLLTKLNSTSYKWHPSRPGSYYFTFNNGSLKTCQDSQKLSIEVSLRPPPPETATPSPEIPPMAAPAPLSGGVVSSSPAYPWPFRPHQAASPSEAPNANSPLTVPTLDPDKNGGIPFINSNPAVPLPTGEVDSATIIPFPTSAHGGKVLMGLLTRGMTLCSVIFLLM
ncbi:hypothetical protein CFOL_v3_03413 [Cephalotus follicularis]|uniref:Cu_bind_like domain-containing protein n=1 Tax=Cephalotus follicularis TaxID=3775 RepID=A0A1Q3AWF2_CEPFO|nr:hypothetical protein CFOL_v3_03413 [Cephalotus follicularis]